VSGTRLIAVAIVAAAWCAAATAGETTDDHGTDGGIAIRLGANANCIEVVGAPPQLLAALSGGDVESADWQRVLAVFVASQRDRQPVPALGSYRVEDRVVVFTPRFPLRPGVDYRVVFDARALDGSLTPSGKIEAIVGIPPTSPSKPAAVEAVYPSGNRLPENVLKFYIHFSAPMARGHAYRHVRIVDVAKGQPVPDAFLEIGEELWDAHGRRLTLFFDPGRVKRGLRPNEEVGAPLTEGGDYELVVDAGWPDAQGQPLRAAHRKAFAVTAADHTQPSPSQWRVNAPVAGGDEPLTVEFNEPLDHALLERMLTVRDPSDQALDGTTVIDRAERRWRFVPARSWQAGQYSLVIDAALEDRAGNSVGRAFETLDPTAEDDAAAHRPIALPFEVRGP
jgi:hypothetical protein